MQFWLQLANMKHVSYKEFRIMNWLSVTEIFNQCISATAFKYLNGRWDHFPNYLSELLERSLKNTFQTRGSFQKLKYLFCKAKMGQNKLFYIVPTIRSKTPDMFKRTNNLNMFNNDLKEHYLKMLKSLNAV